MIPDRLTVTDDFAHLAIQWEDGSHTTLSAATLRLEARDAHSRRELHDRGEIRVTPGLTITGLTQIGTGAAGITFSDGHDRAIYPFAYLRELSDRFGK